MALAVLDALRSDFSRLQGRGCSTRSLCAMPHVQSSEGGAGALAVLGALMCSEGCSLHPDPECSLCSGLRVFGGALAASPLSFRVSTVSLAVCACPSSSTGGCVSGPSLGPVRYACSLVLRASGLRLSVKLPSLRSSGTDNRTGGTRRRDERASPFSIFNVQRRVFVRAIAGLCLWRGMRAPASPPHRARSTVTAVSWHGMRMRGARRRGPTAFAAPLPHTTLLSPAPQNISTATQRFRTTPFVRCPRAAI